MPSPSRPLRPPLAVLLGLVLLVALLHALLLAGVPPGLGPGEQGGVRALSVRQIVLQRAAPAPPAPAAPSPPPRRSPKRVAAPPPAVQSEPATAPVTDDTAPPAASPIAAPDAAASAALAAAAEPIATTPPATAAPADPAVTPSAELTAPTPAAGGAAPPTYATRLPAAALLHYEMRRGVLGGKGELAWRPTDTGYEMVFEGQAFGLPVLAWISRGGFDSAGLAPQRFVDRRRGRDIRAANFQRDSERITYSASAVEHPLLPGAQDRLSWMVQLAAIFEADPARFKVGDQVVMQVAGARGEADLWTFTFGAREPVELVGERVAEALVFRREPRRPFDTQVDVWLDPARQHLPVRLKLTNQPGGDSTEFVLRP